MKQLKMKDNQHIGPLITFCGLDGCGKTTMINQLSEFLGRDKNLFLTKQPTDFVRKSEIFRTYTDKENHEGFDYRSLSLLAASDRLQQINKVIMPALEEGKTVICDRYFYSCLANLRARGYTKDRWIYEIAEYIVKPDIAFFLDVPVDIAISRVRSRKNEKDRYIDIPLQHRLRCEYLDICKANKGVLIPTDCSKEESFDIIKREVGRLKNI